ncbi:MAG: hypothetical protein A3F91_05605 [Flavobacteria bacterium RIFCSPLOWO2_12_FULL_35_11]|nr:MAG: hypothetical protein A3F91_05605 [Flavobacteria bacterium RIFCSPLOWO2_12_FULL_35_11]
MKNKMKYFAVLFSILLMVSCKDKQNYSKINNETPAAKSDVHKIVVKETVDGGNYAYLNVEENGKTYWMAIANMPVTVGETYYYEDGMVMKDFESKQLNKTFDEIVFVNGVRTTEVAVEVKQEDPHASSAPAPVSDVKIEKPKNGTSLSELFSAKKSFSGKSIIVKGQVVKVNNGIMDKNWVHIVDGTQFENKNDLTITTTETVNIGDVVTFKGVIVLDKDFGQGYNYDVLLEEGKLIK